MSSTTFLFVSLLATLWLACRANNCAGQNNTSGMFYYRYYTDHGLKTIPDFSFVLLAICLLSEV